MSVDTYWNTVGTRGYLNAAATRDAVQNGLKAGTKEFAEHVTNYKPTTTVIRAADEFAKTNTMAKELTGIAEWFDNGIEMVGTKVPLMRVLVPFFKTNANLIEAVAQRSPLAPLVSADFRSAMRSGGVARDEAIAKMASGSIALAGFTYLAAGGSINGKNAENPTLERALKDNKTIPLETSVKVNGKWVSLKGVEPISSIVNMAHFLSKASGHLEEEEYQAAIVAAMSWVSEIASPEQLTDSLSGLMKVARGEEGAPEYLATIPARFTPAGGLMTDVRQTVDVNTRNTNLGKIKGFQDFVESVRMKYQNQIPGMSKYLPIDRNFWGEELELPDGMGPDAVSLLASTSEDGLRLKSALEKLDSFYSLNKGAIEGAFDAAAIDPIVIQKPSRYIKNPFGGPDYRLSPKEYSAYQLLAAGKNYETGESMHSDGDLKTVTTQVLQEYGVFDKKVQDISTDDYIALNKELSSRFAIYRQVADKLILQYSDIESKMKQAADKSRGLFEAETLGGLQDVTK
jgi:hypothetical protein